MVPVWLRDTWLGAVRGLDRVCVRRRGSEHGNLVAAHPRVPLLRFIGGGPWMRAAVADVCRRICIQRRARIWNDVGASGVASSFNVVFGLRRDFALAWLTANERCVHIVLTSM